MANRLTDTEVEALDALPEYAPGLRPERAEDLRLGTYLKNLEGSAGATPVTQTGIEADAVAGDFLIMTALAPRTVNLPAAPEDGTRVTVKEAAGTIQPITIVAGAFGGTQDVFEDGSTEAVMTDPFASFTFAYLDGTWYVV
jgi:hypothetical protein